MLVDSSVWIEFLRGSATAEVAILRLSLERGEPVWVAAPVLQEVLQGADSRQRFRKWERILGELPMIEDTDLRELTRSAAHIYARCRWRGFTSRSANDCLIAAYAIRAAMPLLHRDRDFERIAEIEPKLALVGKGQ